MIQNSLERKEVNSFKSKEVETYLEREEMENNSERK